MIVAKLELAGVRALDCRRRQLMAVPRVNHDVMDRHITGLDDMTSRDANAGPIGWLPRCGYVGFDNLKVWHAGLLWGCLSDCACCASVHLTQGRGRDALL